MPVQFACEHCGRPIRVREGLAGRRVACPGCAATVTVPDGPVPATPTRQADRPATPGEQAPNPWLPFSLALCAAALVLGALGYLLWGRWGQAGRAGPLVQWVPGKGDTFVSVRLADVVRSPQVREAAGEALGQFGEEGPPGPFEELFGLRANQVERATEVLAGSESWTVVETISDYDQARARLGEATEGTHEGKNYLKGRLRRFREGPYVHFTGPRMIVFAHSEPALRMALSVSANRKPGPLDDGLALLSAGRHVVRAINGPKAAQFLPGGPEAPSPKSGTFCLTINQTVTLEVANTYADSSQAQAARASIVEGLEKATYGLGEREEDQDRLAFLTSVRVARSGAQVSAYSQHEFRASLLPLAHVIPFLGPAQEGPGPRDIREGGR